MPLAADSVLSHELKSLQEEVAAAHRERHRSSPAMERVGPAVAAAAAEEGISDEVVVRDQLTELIDHITQFFADAEKNIAAHPTESIVAALLLGILIGRLSGRC